MNIRDISGSPQTLSRKFSKGSRKATASKLQLDSLPRKSNVQGQRGGGRTLRMPLACAKEACGRPGKGPGAGAWHLPQSRCPLLTRPPAGYSRVKQSTWRIRWSCSWSRYRRHRAHRQQARRRRRRAARRMWGLARNPAPACQPPNTPAPWAAASPAACARRWFQPGPGTALYPPRAL